MCLFTCMIDSKQEHMNNSLCTLYSGYPLLRMYITYIQSYSLVSVRILSLTHVFLPPPPGRVQSVQHAQVVTGIALACARCAVGDVCCSLLCRG